MGIGVKDVQYLAELARLEVSAEDAAHLAGELDRLLEYFAGLRAADTSTVEPTYHVLPLQNVMRDDTGAAGLPRDRALANAPQQDGAFFVVPRILA